MAIEPRPPPERLVLTAGALPAAGTLPEPYPFETIAPLREGFVERGGVRSWYAQFGDAGPWLAFAPIYQIANTHVLKGVVPYLAQHFRVVVMDLRGNGRSDRPASPEAYSFEHYFADFVAVLDRLEIDRTAVVGISATTMVALRLAAEQPARVSHLVIAGGFAERTLADPAVAGAVQRTLEQMRNDWPAYLDKFFSVVFTEPHSTKPYEDGVLQGWASDGATVAMGWAGWLGTDMREQARGIRCPVLVIHGDDDRRVPYPEHVARYPWIRDRAIFVGNPQDLPHVPFGPDLPMIDDWTRRNFSFTGYALPFDPKTLADTDALRARHGYRRDEKLVIAAVGGTAVGAPLLHRIADAFPAMKRQLPELRMLLVAGPRLPRDAFPEHVGLDVLPYVHNLFEHLACSDLALVQGGLSTCMELVATRRPFLSFPLERHFEQCIHVRNRLRNYCADCSVRFNELSSGELAERALREMHQPVNFTPVETNGAARAATEILSVLENRAWANG